MADNWMLGESAALDDYIPNAPTNILGNAAQGVRDWYTNQPSWLDRARAENQRTTEAFQRGGMGEIAKQLATDTTEPQELYGAFGVGNVKGVKPPLAPGALAATSEYRPPFYSAVEQAVQGAKQNAAPGQQWAGFLRNQPGVKPEEIEALKLGKLFEQPGSVSKEALLGEIAGNRVNVGEVMKGAQQPDRAALDAAAQYHFSGPFDSLSPSAQQTTRNLIMREQNIEPTKFSQYTLPGGENYREMLLTLPEQKGSGFDPAKVELRRKQQSTTQGSTIVSYDGKNIGTFDDPPTLNTQTGQYHQRPDQYWIDIMRRRYGGDPQMGIKPLDQGVNFRSSHYDEPNILAHVRYNDRVIDGKKTLFVEEVQSDWHQAGKRKGYIQPPEPLEDTSGWTAKVEKNNEFTGQRDVRVYDAEGNFRGLRSGTRATDAEIINDFAQSRAAEHPPGQVPDAPFKTTWPELAMKRIIREAAEKGYDKVAWTPGSVQADRYDLSKQVNSIDVTTRSDARTGQPAGRAAYIKLPDGHALSVGVAPDGVIDNVGANNRDWKGKKLEDVIGKEMAEKIMKAKNGDTFTGLDLKVGGEGMKGFYDEILPATVNKLVKKHGGRVDSSNLFEGSPEKWEPVRTANGDFWQLRNVDDGYRGSQEFATRQQAYDFLNEGKSHSVHTLDITPSLRAAAMKGFPLFTAGGVAATGVMGEMARQDDYRQ